MIIIFLGGPYSGKGTQAKMLGEKLNLSVFDMGQLIRSAREAGDERAILGFEQYSMKGLYVPTHLKFPFLREKMEQATSGFILDHFPATQDDLTVFLDYIKEKNLSINKVFNIRLSEEEMLKRFKERGRPDDTPEIIKKRREIQEIDRKPVIDYFKIQGLLEEIDGDSSIKNIQEEILRRLSL